METSLVNKNHRYLGPPLNRVKLLRVINCGNSLANLVILDSSLQSMRTLLSTVMIFT